MSEKEFYYKIELLKVMQADVWLRNKSFGSEKDKQIFKNILILESLRVKHSEVVNNFISAAKKEYPNINFNFFREPDLINLVNENHKTNEKIYFLFFAIVNLRRCCLKE